MPVEDFLALSGRFSSSSRNRRKREKTRGKTENSFRMKKRLPNLSSAVILSLLSYLSQTISNGQVSEWSNEHAWKVCVPQTGTEGSNPSLSAILFFLKPCNALDFARLFHIVIAQYLSVFAKKYILGRIDFLRP